jgi:acyl carrier protein
MPSVRDQVIAIIAQRAVVDVTLIGPETRIEQLGLDSLGMVESLFAIEETFAVSVPFNTGPPGMKGFKLSSVGEIIALVETLVADKA